MKNKDVLEKAAEEYATIIRHPLRADGTCVEQRYFDEKKCLAFKAGAQWQAEQDKADTEYLRVVREKQTRTVYSSDHNPEKDTNWIEYKSHKTKWQAKLNDIEPIARGKLE